MCPWGGEYFEGRHLVVNPEDHGLEIVFSQDEDGDTSDSDSQEEVEVDPPSAEDSS